MPLNFSDVNHIINVKKGMNKFFVYMSKRLQSVYTLQPLKL